MSGSRAFLLPRVRGQPVPSHRQFVILLLLAVAVPATAHTLGFSLGLSAKSVCLEIGNATYRLSEDATAADYTVRIDPGAATMRVHLAESPDNADFVLVDDGVAQAACRGGAATRTVAVTTTGEAGLTVALAPEAAADYRIFVRSERLSPEAAAALFAVSRKAQGRAVAER